MMWPVTDKRKKPVKVLHYDADAVVVCKDAGVAVEGGGAVQGNPFLDSVREYLIDNGAAPFTNRTRPRLVYPVDEDASGLVLVARGIDAKRKLISAMKSGDVQIEYHAFVRGEPAGEEFACDAPVGEHKGRFFSTHGKNKKEAVTNFRVLERVRGFALVAAFPRTCAGQQVRVHLNHSGWPLVVDPTHGGAREFLLSHVKAGYREKKTGENPVIGRLTLHVASIELFGKVLEAPMPKDMKYLHKVLKKYR